MTKYLELLEKRRMILLKETEDITSDQYNIVPPGFNNNIIWNMGHTLTVSEGLLYSKTPFGIPIHEFDIDRFKMGTKPQQGIDDYGIALIRKSLSETVAVFRTLLREAELASPPLFKSYSLRAMVGDKALNFMLFHEDMHFAKIQQLLRYV